MKQLEIIPLNNPITASVQIPGSKSYTNRALLISALVENEVRILNPLYSEDTEAMLGCLKGLGIYIEKDIKSITVKGNINQTKDGVYNLNAKFSGTTIRFILALVCLIPGTKILTGEDSLNKRPIKDLVEGLRQLGAEIEYLEKEGFPPLKISGKILNRVKNDKLTKVNIDGSVSSQFLSAILMISPLIGDVEIEIIGELISKPYVDMTIEIMKKFGVEVINNNYKVFRVISGQRYEAREYLIEGDYSSAGYFFAIAALTGSNITLNNLNPYSKQADRQLLDVLKKMGNEISYEKNGVTIKGNGKVTPVNINMEDFPDQAQTLAVLVAFAKGVSKISGVKTLRIKETDRLKALQNELQKMGIKTEITDNVLLIYGGNPKPAVINTYGDHRMAMAFAVAGSKLPGMKINNPEVVSKTFPDFWKILKQAGDDSWKYTKIFLVGFRGTGKTTLARKLAEDLGWKFIDSDELIFKKAGESVDVLTKNGSDWLRFRQIENEVIGQIIAEKNIVVSCGGGVGVNNISDPKTKKTFGQLNKEILKSCQDCLIVLLKASDGVIRKRLTFQYKEKKKIMPVLTPSKAKEITQEEDEDRLVRKMVEDSMDTYEIRKPLYEELTNVKINTDDSSKEKAAKEIIKYVR